jgi:hypothetical protein
VEHIIIGGIQSRTTRHGILATIGRISGHYVATRDVVVQAQPVFVGQEEVGVVLRGR